MSNLNNRNAQIFQCLWDDLACVWAEVWIPEAVLGAQRNRPGTIDWVAFAEKLGAGVDCEEVGNESDEEVGPRQGVSLSLQNVGSRVEKIL